MSRIRLLVGDMTGASNPTMVAHWGRCMGSQGVRLGGGGGVRLRDQSYPVERGWPTGVWFASINISNDAWVRGVVQAHVIQQVARTGSLGP